MTESKSLTEKSGMTTGFCSTVVRADVAFVDMFVLANEREVERENRDQTSMDTTAV